jgi:predicted PurR-regulated permease PerM
MALSGNPKGLAGPARESLRVLGVYVRAQVLIAVILTVLYAVAFGLARVPFWPLIAVAGGLTSLIPRFGALVPLALVALANLLGDRNVTHLVIAFAAWVAIQIVEAFVITPRLLSKPLGLRPLPVFLALLAGSFLFGPIGFLLAVPVLAVSAVFWRYFRDRRP